MYRYIFFASQPTTHNQTPTTNIWHTFCNRCLQKKQQVKKNKNKL